MDLPLRAGDVLAGRYQLERRLGEGGMGLVFAATHVELGRRVAIKLLRAESSDSAAIAARFLIEARATARLNGPHVAKLIDMGRLDEQTPFLVMEYLEGKNLQELLLEQGPQSITQSADYLLHACEALAEAHRAGIVHRDLKPANLFLTRDAYGDPSIKVLDFGISKFLEPSVEEALGLTDSRALMGSPVYMSPEQMRSARDVDHRTDIWSLGTVLFELLTGRPVWNGQSLSELCAQVNRDPAPDLVELCPTAPPELSAIVARCLHKDVALRYQQVTDIALALERFASVRGKATVPHVLFLAGQQPSHQLPTDSGQPAPRSAAAASSESTLQGTAATRSDVRSRRLPLTAMAVALLGAVAGFMWIGRGPTTQPPSPLSSAPTVAPTPVAPAPAIPARDATSNPIAGEPSADGSIHRTAPMPSALGRTKKPAAQPKSSAPAATASPVPSTDPMSIRK